MMSNLFCLENCAKSIFKKCSLVIISKIYSMSVSEDHFVLTNSTDSDLKSLYAVFYLGLHCFPKYPFKGFIKRLSVFKVIANL